ncbi:MAG: abortive infection family protein [Bacteroidia bacterium]|nr:abortive infection family protein [Bacteroidia bacterium]
MDKFVSPSYAMKLIKNIAVAILAEYSSSKDVLYYIKKWHKSEGDNFSGWWENFSICINNGNIELDDTLHNIDEETLIKIAIDLGIDTPDFIPCVASFRNEIKSDYKTASLTFEKAFKQIETHPDIAIGLANAALESIIKEIFKDERIETKPKTGKTLYDLTSELLKEFQLFPNSDMPIEMKTIGSSLLTANQSIEKLRSEKTNAHGKTSEDYIIEDSLYTYFIVNSVSTVGLFLNSFYKKKFLKLKINNVVDDGLPF